MIISGMLINEFELKIVNGVEYVIYKGRRYKVHIKPWGKEINFKGQFIEVRV